MLKTETWTLDEAITDVETSIDEIETERERHDEDSDRYASLTNRRNRLAYYRNGLLWQRDEEDWGSDAVLELGAMTAGEKAMMHRDIPETAQSEERRLWFVAACTAAGPYHTDDDLPATFRALAACHDGFVSWAEAQINGLGLASSGPAAEAGEGNRSGTSSEATEDSATSTKPSDSTTSSSSDSPAA